MTGIGDRGVLNGERIGFSVAANCDLKNFLIFKTNFTTNGFYNRSQAVFWFSPEAVKKGDRVVVYTKAGTDSFQTNPDGSTIFFRYWGLNTPVFTSSEQGVVLARVTDWYLSRGLST